jgi:hypothetical protein
VAFTVTPTTAATSNPIASVLVEFGDGQSQTLGAITGPVGLTHVYGSAGGYTATATTIDISGGRGVSSVGVVVGFAALPTITMTATPNPVSSSGTANGVVSFTTTAAAASGGPPIRSVRVVLQDGTVIYNGTGPGSFTYRFGGSGNYVVTATVTDAAGNVGQSSTVVVVQP